MSQNIIQLLQERDFIDNTTSNNLDQICAQKIGVYIGFDPTAPSLHLGNLVGIIALGWFQKWGHPTFALAGGATGIIGDPTGKSKDRPLLDSHTLAKNLTGIQRDLEGILKFNPQKPVVVLNNYDWYHSFSVLDFLHQVAQHVRLSTLLHRETVKERLQSQEGMSFKEFSYPLLQGYDFLHLYREHQVQLQLGGSDQWTNITAGMDLIRKVEQKEAFGLTFPLLTRSDGKKFGKSEDGAIWLSKELLSPYDFYQHLVRTPDADVISLLKMLTYLDLKDIHAIESSMKQENATANAAQKILAKEVTEIVHGKEAVEVAQQVTERMRPGLKTDLNLENLKLLANEVPHVTLKTSQVIDQKMIDILIGAGLSTSKGECRRLIQNGGLYLNNERILDENMVVEKSHLIEDECLLIAMGKKKKVILFVCP